MSRKLDALVAERVFGFSDRVFCYAFDDRAKRDHPFIAFRNAPKGASRTLRTRFTEDGKRTRELFDDYPVYSESMNAAWEVVEKMRGAGFDLTLQDCGPFDHPFIMFAHEDDRYGCSDHEPVGEETAICLAALRALGVSEEEIAEAMA